MFSDNKNEVSLFNIENDFTGLANAVQCFFPSIRHEMILRFRAETIAKIGIEAYKMAQNENIKTNPIPLKIAVPLIEKMSLEHELDMYKKWARLLISSSINPNPIQLQYADILSKLNNHCANLLIDIYKKQPDSDEEIKYNEYCSNFSFLELYDDIINRNKMNFVRNGKNESLLPTSLTRISSEFGYPHVLYSSKCKKNTENNYEFSFDDKNMIFGLNRMGLVKYEFLAKQQREDMYEKPTYVQRCGLLLTQFGYSFIDCLENKRLENMT